MSYYYYYYYYYYRCALAVAVLLQVMKAIERGDSADVICAHCMHARACACMRRAAPTFEVLTCCLMMKWQWDK
jgi:hypothetical protein